MKGYGNNHTRILAEYAVCSVKVQSSINKCALLSHNEVCASIFSQKVWKGEPVLSHFVVI